MKATREVVVGLVFFGTLALLGFYTVYISNLGAGKAVQLVANFDRIEGLKRGDYVLVDGVRVGTVTEVKLLQDSNQVQVRMGLKEPLVLREGFKLQVKESTLLGGHVVSIRRGSPDARPVDLSQVLQGQLYPPPLETIGDLAQGPLRETLENFRRVTHAIAEGRGTVGRLINEDDPYRKLVQGINDLAGLIHEAREGQGLLQAMVYDPQAARDFRNGLSGLREIAGRLERGEGSLGRFLKEDEVYVNVKETAATARRLVADAEAGKGIVGLALRDEQAARDLKEGIENLREFTAGMNKEGGLVTRLFKDEQLGSDFKELVGGWRVITAQIKAGKGTFGKLLMDETLAAEIQRVVNQVSGLVETARESEPLNTFTRALFNVF